MNRSQILLLFPFLCLILGFSSCQEKRDLIGVINPTDFKQKPFNGWFNTEYDSYVLDTVTLHIVQPEMQGAEILIFLGTWCSDSQREVPRFLKMLNYLDFDPAALKIIGVDREKTAPGYENNAWKIEFVPTMIILKNGKEAGRIIETPEKSLEKDLLGILQSIQNI